MAPKLKIAAIQAEPVWQDLEGGVNKSIALIEEAASKGANVVGFPEVFIPGYPWYVAARGISMSSLLGLLFRCLANYLRLKEYLGQVSHGKCRLHGRILPKLPCEGLG